MTVHRLKTAATFFEHVKLGHKMAELRRDDRGFALGNTLELVEIDADMAETGRTLRCIVTHIVRDTDGPWLTPGHCMMSFVLIS